MSSVIIITGPTGVGKTTISKKLCQKLPKCALIEVDKIKHQVKTDFYYNNSNEGRIQWEICTKNIIDLAQNFLEKEYNVIIEGFLGNYGKEAWKRVFQTLPVKNAFLLLPKLETVIERDKLRNDEIAMGENAVRIHYKHFSKKNLFKDFQIINTFGQTVSESVVKINQLILKTSLEKNSFKKTIYDIWNEVKQIIERTKKRVFFREKEIWFSKLGKNIGFEQDGKGSDFLRPILIIKKFNNQVFLGIPLSKTKKTGKYYFKFIYTGNIKSVAILSQIRLFDAKRLKYKSGEMRKNDFQRIKKAIKMIFDDS